MLRSIRSDIRKQADPERAKASHWFFKTGKGEYGEGDVFIGLAVPVMRKIAKKYKGASFADLQKLLESKIHEERFVALEILVMQYEKAEKAADQKGKRQVYSFYIKYRKHINNWDLVDTSAPYIVGPYLLERGKIILEKLAKSKSLWDRRIAVLATFHFIKNGDFTASVRIAKILLSDPHDLIHKAVGWMLREVGKKSKLAETVFLDRHAAHMPRTMLRYALEKFPPEERKAYLKKNS